MRASLKPSAARWQQQRRLGRGGQLSVSGRPRVTSHCPQCDVVVTSWRSHCTSATSRNYAGEPTASDASLSEVRRRSFTYLYAADCHVTTICDSKYNAASRGTDRQRPYRTDVCLKPRLHTHKGASLKLLTASPEFFS